MTKHVRKVRLLAFLLLTASLLLISCAKSENPQLETQSLSDVLGSSVSHTVKTGTNETFTLSTSSLTELLLIDKWKQIKKPSDMGELIITVIISDGYEIRVYENCVSVYDGGAGFTVSRSAYYKAPDSVAKKARALKDRPYSDI